MTDPRNQPPEEDLKNYPQGSGPTQPSASQQESQVLPDSHTTASKTDDSIPPAESIEQPSLSIPDPLPDTVYAPAPQPVPGAPTIQLEDESLHQALLKRSLAADQEVLAGSRRHTRRSFLVAAAGAAAAYSFYRYLDHAPEIARQPGPFHDAFEVNAGLSRDIFREHALAPTYPLSRAENLRVNGTYGLQMELVPESYRLQLVGMKVTASHPRFQKDVTAWEYKYTKAASKEDSGHDTKVDPKLLSSAKMAPEDMLGKCQEDENHTGRKPRGKEEAGESKSTLTPGTSGLLLTMEDVLKLPRHEMVTQFKCIEGWSQIVQWAGVRMADFLDLYPPDLIDGKEPRYVYMETPDGDYYTGYDMHVMRHPQTLLVTEMMGAPLTQFHGAPLRLHMPTKYGYKQIKRVALISYTNAKPDDYWTKLGYDWYAGL